MKQEAIVSYGFEMCNFDAHPLQNTYILLFFVGCFLLFAYLHHTIPICIDTYSYIPAVGCCCGLWVVGNLVGC